MRMVIQKLRVKLQIQYNTLFQKKVKNVMRLFIKTKELLPVNKDWFQYFPLKSFFTKTYNKNTFDCFCNILI